MSLDAHAGAGLRIEVARGAVLPFELAGRGIEGIDVRAVVVGDSRGGVGDAILSTRTPEATGQVDISMP